MLLCSQGRRLSLLQNSDIIIIDDDITSLKYSPIQDQLAVGFTNGNVEVLDGRGNLQHNLDFTSLLV